MNKVPTLRVIAGRPASKDYLYAEAHAPVLTDDLKHVRAEPLWKSALVWLAEAIFAGLAILACVWAFAAFVLSLSVPR